jgi:cytochrome c5
MSAIPQPSNDIDEAKVRPLNGPALFLHALLASALLFILPACNEGSHQEKTSTRVGINHEEDASKPISLAQDNKYSLNSLTTDKKSKAKEKTKHSDLSANGEELYTVLCSSCHGGAINLVGKNLADLQKAINEVPEMASLDGVVCSDPELTEALFSYINGNLSP